MRPKQTTITLNEAAITPVSNDLLDRAYKLVSAFVDIMPRDEDPQYFGISFVLMSEPHGAIRCMQLPMQDAMIAAILEQVGSFAPGAIVVIQVVGRPDDEAPRQVAFQVECNRITTVAVATIEATPTGHRLGALKHLKNGATATVRYTSPIVPSGIVPGDTRAGRKPH